MPIDTISPPCSICGENVLKFHQVREMMFGIREQFRYAECSGCGALKLVDVPGDMSLYYPSEYYSMTNFKSSSSLSTFFKRLRGRYLYLDPSFIPGKMATLIFGVPHYAYYIQAFKLNFESKILDVGCGSGELLHELHLAGFKNLTGTDPFIERDLNYPSGIRVFKSTANELTEVFDAIMLHHSFEHMDAPEKVLTDIRNRLVTGGKVLVRIPVINQAWRQYGVNWVQLDAPRHIYVHSEKSMMLLAEKTGFAVDNIIYDSSAFQFWGSEQYARDIPLINSGGRQGNTIFTNRQIQAFEHQARELNAKGFGDQACFYLTKK